MSKTIIITGIYGLIGSNFARWVLTHKPEYEIYGIDNHLGGLLENKIEDPRVHYRGWDLSRSDWILGKLFEQIHPEYVFHFAAYAPEGLSPYIRKFIYKNNVLSTLNIINCCIQFGVKRLVFTSSMAVYGSQQAPFSEFEECRPIDPYGNAKLAEERELVMAHDQFGLNYTILRPHNVYGPGQNIFDPYRNVIGIWMYRMLHHQPLIIYGDGRQRRSFTYVGDILAPIWDAAAGLDQYTSALINLGYTPDVEIRKAAALVWEEGVNAGLNPTIEFAESRYEVREAFVTGNRARDLLGFTDIPVPLEEGIKRMWEWVQTLDWNREQDSGPALEIRKGLPSYWKSAGLF